MVLDKINLNRGDCALLMDALEMYEKNIKNTGAHELWLTVQSEYMRLRDVERRKEAGLAVYIFHDKEGKEIAVEEMHDDGEAWRYTYEVLAPYYPKGVTFERREDD